MGHKVLLVDDEPNVLMGLQRALRKEPYEVLTAGSGKEGLALLNSTEIDVVVSDEDMPGMTGTEFLRQVHVSHPKTVRFMLTGKPSLDVAIKAINDGAISRFFTKPCNEVDLRVTIRQALQHKDLMNEAWQLLKKVKEQETILEQLERESPGITHVETDDRGAIVLDGDVPADYDAFMEELHRTMGD